MQDKVSCDFTKIFTFIVIFTLIIFVLTPLTSNNVSAEDGTGVGVKAVRPRITNVELEHNVGTQHLRLEIFDLNSWKYISEVSVKFYRGGELVRHYVFNQTEDLDRSVEVRKGDGLVDFESHSSKKRATTDQRCSLNLHFHFSGINYDQLKIRARDHSGGTAQSTIDSPSVTRGRSTTIWLLPFIILLAIALVYKEIKDTGGEIDGA